MNKILREDFEKVYQDKFQTLKGKSILVTGANGMLAGYILNFFSWLNDTYSYGIKASGVVRAMKKKIPGVTYIVSDVSRVELKEHYDYIIHAASLASPVHYGPNPIGVSIPNIQGTINLLTHAENFPPASFLFISSSEVYGDFGLDKAAIEENEFGKLDPMNHRSSYAESKRMGESLCVSWFMQKKIHTKVVRPFHTYGPGLKKDDGRIYANFIYSIVEGKNITLNSKGEAKRAFCYLSDALSGILLVLLEGKDGEAYNLGNPAQEFSVREAADIATNIHPDRQISVEINEVSSQGYIKSPVLRNCPSIAKLSQLGWKPSITLKEGMKRTVEFIEGEA